MAERWLVDDIVVRRDGQSSFKGYQLKNAQNVTWTGDIEKDFQWQYSVCQNEAYSDIRLRLVCSDKDAVQKLATSVPGPIATFSKAFFFPFDRAMLPLLKDYAWLKEDFGYLSKHNEPSVIDVDQVAAVVMGACDSLGQVLTASMVMEKARDMSPTLLRSTRSNDEANACLTKELRSLLDSWEDFSYQISKGFLSWNAFGGTMKGVLSFDCFSQRFATWQQEILRATPKDFQDVEGAFV